MLILKDFTQIHVPKKLFLLGNVAKAIGVANWMKISLPGYDALKKPLQDILERMYKSVGNNRRNSAVEDFGWNIDTDIVWEQLKQKIINAVNVTHRDPAKVLVLYTDVSLVDGLLYCVKLIQVI